jgi:DNA-binding NtrC family response regulator
VLVADGEEIQEADLLLGATRAVTPWAERTRPTAPPAPTSRAASREEHGDGAHGEAPAAPAGHGFGAFHGLPDDATSGDSIGTASFADALVALPSFAQTGAPQPQPAAPASGTGSDHILPLDDMKRLAVERAFVRCGGNAERAASELGIGRATMYRLLKKYDIQTE